MRVLFFLCSFYQLVYQFIAKEKSLFSQLDSGDFIFAGEFCAQFLVDMKEIGCVFCRHCIHFAYL
jgi:hypothetical protein